MSSSSLNFFSDSDSTATVSPSEFQIAQRTPGKPHPVFPLWYLKQQLKAKTVDALGRRFPRLATLATLIWGNPKIVLATGAGIAFCITFSSSIYSVVEVISGNAILTLTIGGFAGAAQHNLFSRFFPARTVSVGQETKA
jgi:hypothetical protein